MKAAVLNRPGGIEQVPLEMAQLPVPEPAPQELLLKVRVCGLCHTDLHIIEGDLALPRLPIVPGHQIVGLVEKVGTEVSPSQVGNLVGVGWLNWTCGACSFCRSERENLCPKGRFTGYHTNGGYAEYVVAPHAFTYSIPDGFSDEQAAPLLCGGVVGYRALRLSEIQPGEALGLYGYGASAHIVMQIALFWGCKVFVFTRSPAHQELAMRMGATWVGQAQDQAPLELDSGIIFAPAGSLVPMALNALKRGGTLALAGITMSPIPEMRYQSLYGERTLRSVANATRLDAQELLGLATEIPIKTKVQLFSLAEVNHALQLLKEGMLNGAGVVEVH